MFAQSPILEILTSGHNLYLQTSYKLGQLWSYNIQIDQASSMRVHRYFLFLQAVEFDSLSDFSGLQEYLLVSRD